jgi:hypothetical protein
MLPTWAHRIRNRRTIWTRPALRTACVIWLLIGIFKGIEGFGIPPQVAWRPVGMVVFLLLNAFAGAVVLAECAVLIRPGLETQRAAITKAVMFALFVLSLAQYLVFVHRHAVGLY